MVDVSEGKMMSKQNTLARGVLPLTEAATQLLQVGGNQARPVRVQVRQRGDTNHPSQTKVGHFT